MKWRPREANFARVMKWWTGCVVVGWTVAHGQAPAPATDASDTARRQFRDTERVHDPSTIVRVGGTNRCFCTGPGVSVMRQEPSGKWQREGRLFEADALPAWHSELVPGNRGYLWAPDVIRVGEKYFVYYSVSTFGKNRSAIGLAVGSSIDPGAKDWGWNDRGPVVISGSGDRFNAIDPALFRDGPALWMTFGSFWDGIHLVELDPETGLRRRPDEKPLRLAYTPEIEAPFLHQRGGFYYLFVNWGKCCRGTNSTYEIRVGRSRVVTGPYADREGTKMSEGGGTRVLASAGRWIGPGHASIHEQDGREWLVHHYYDGEQRGAPRLRLVPLRWDGEGWPEVTAAE